MNYEGGMKESHLLNVIVSLQGQELICDADRSKDRNISEFNEINTKLNEQITEKHHALKQIPEVYSNVLENIKFAQGKIKSCKEKIDRCKTSLQCQREDLKRLYLDSVTNGQILDLLARIDKVREVSGTLDNHIKGKHYQHATKLLKTNVALLEGNLSSVDALKEIKEDLKRRKDTLHLELRRQLQNHLYLKAPSAKEKVQLFRSGEPPEMDNEEEYEDEEEDLSKDPEEDTYKFLKLLIQSLQQLDKLDDTIEFIERNMETELKNILINTAQDLLYKKRLTNQIEDQPTLFSELLEECFAKYRAVAASHHVVINAIEHLRYSRQASRYTTSIVWGKIQTCVEILLKDYLAVDLAVSNEAPQNPPISYVTTNNDLSLFFARTAKRPERVVRGNLFTFESSVTGMTISSECRSQQYNNDMAPAAQELPTICQKSPHNITLVFKQISSFIKEIDNVINMTGNQVIPLQHFLNDFVDERFLPTLQAKVKRDIADATEGNSGLNMVKLPETKIGWPRPLLQGTLKVQEQLVELRGLMNRMPKYCNKFLDIIYELLKYYKRICHNTFKNIVGINTLPGMNEMICHIWFKDEKLLQIIRSLPMWSEMFKGTIREQVSSHSDLVASIGTHQGKDVLDKDSMIAESERLVQLAQLQDSIMWLVQYVESFVENLQCDKELQEQLTGSNAKLLEDCRSLLNERCSELMILAEECLLILFLEIRVQCYFHLLIVLRKQDYKVDMVNSDPDVSVTLLNKFLSQLEEKIRDFLPSSHVKFLFEGLGYVMSNIIIVNASYIKEMNSGGLKKMSRNILALQQNLTNITLTCELELERARIYYELLYQKPEEILRNIVEQQKRFSKAEYVELIQLYYRSNRSNKNKRSEKQLNLHLVKLNEIMETAGETDS